MNLYFSSILNVCSCRNSPHESVKDFIYFFGWPEVFLLCSAFLNVVYNFENVSPYHKYFENGRHLRDSKRINTENQRKAKTKHPTAQSYILLHQFQSKAHFQVKEIKS